MGTFLLLLFIFFFVIPLVRGVYTVYVMRKKMRDAVNSMYGRQEGTPRSEPQSRKAGWTSPGRRKKKIGNDVGEYVKFEEITVVTTQTHSEKAPDKGSVTVESQITDAEWEDIK